ncbi:MAG: hypothetical protein Q8M94_10290 [Ignavibacteria bacterium]|nr:hypothetical protein [Ignavibacteria bacterium]
MFNKILFLFLIIFFVSSTKSFSQTFEIKGGVGVYNVYENDILTGRPREVKFNPSPFVSFILEWKLSENIYLGWENRLRIKSGSIDYIGMDTLNKKLATRFKSKTQFYYVDSKAVVSFKIEIDNNFFILPFLNTGVAFSFLDDSPRTEVDYSIIRRVVEIPPDGTMSPENESIFKRSGFIGGGGIKVNHKCFIFGFCSDIEFFKTFLYNVGEPSYFYTTFFIGYRF